MHEPVDSRQRRGVVGENLAPFGEGLVGRDEKGSAFIAGGDQLPRYRRPSAARVYLAGRSEKRKYSPQLGGDLGNCGLDAPEVKGLGQAIVLSYRLR